jgi:hypothetical protein
MAFIGFIQSYPPQMLPKILCSSRKTRVSSLLTRNKETKEEQLPALILVIFKKESHEVRMSDLSYFAIQPH